MLDNQSENTYNVIVNNSFEVYKPLTRGCSPIQISYKDSYLKFKRSKGNNYDVSIYVVGG